ncbi:hypothetical protein FNF27_03719 [Cafeteria roenbergensis]|uniref:Dolichyl-diphosphooligosaccharide--protein glycosyltransferase subunit 1 n=1 Tax=Cafeteria roenbergensis TaxID=33653 RepID=A0A5A8EA97_CAFRO|nr:hypothetical protein FNF27_03719 [Cafeteria roenbergensis]
MTTALCLLGVAALASADYVNDRVHTTYSIASSVVQVHIEADVAAVGDGGAPYEFSLPAAWRRSVSPVIARDQTGAVLEVRRSEVETEALDSRATHSVLPRKGSPLTGLQLAFSVNRALTAAGPSRRGAEHSELVFNGSVVLASSYETSEAEADVVLGEGARLVGTSAAAGVAVVAEAGGTRVRFGKILPGRACPAAIGLGVHLAVQWPLTTLEASELEVTVDHWGTIGMRELAVVRNDAAPEAAQARALAGEPGATVTSMAVGLPEGATSAVVLSDDQGLLPGGHLEGPGPGGRLVSVRPRFPLAPGWRAQLRLQYSVASGSQGALSHDMLTGEYVLRVPVAAPFTSAAVERRTVRVALPAGAAAIQASWSAEAGFGGGAEQGDEGFVEDGAWGRPVRVFRSGAVAPGAGGELVVRYSLSPLSLLREPLAWAAMVFLAHLAVSVGCRADMLRCSAR